MQEDLNSQPERIIEELGDEPGSLALLAYLLHESYEDFKSKNRVDHADYDRLGGVRGAIGRRAQEVYDKQGEEVKKAVFRELVVVGEPDGPPTRRAALYTRLTRDETAKALVDALTQARLLVQRDSHTADSGLSHSIAVGLYPQGASESGALDMAENAWEWCLNEFETFSTGLEGENRRSFRGGSFASERFRARFRARRADPHIG